MPDGAVDAAALERAIARDELFLVYQPKIDVRGGRLAGVEALVRWRHPVAGALGPDAFIPLAEETGLIDALTRWVIARALADCRAWADRGLAIDPAVNVSAHNLGSVDFPDMLAALCEGAGVAPESLVVELTESATQELAPLLDTLTRLRLKGVRIALDDFGTGYSSLVQLLRLPLCEVKIDRSFVGHADGSRDARVITKAAIDLAHNLGLQAVAEGVETQRVLDLLREFGCDLAQGYHLARPMPSERLLVWAAARNGAGKGRGEATGPVEANPTD
jgi:EAL domain-containing protein (putative c-di-GMP-specific phosphodiesterase class I)